MLRTLLESNAPRQRRHASAAASVVAHTVIIGAAIAATASARSSVPTTRHVVGEERPVFTRPIPRRPPEGSRERGPERRTSTRGWVEEGLRVVPQVPDFEIRSPAKPLGEIDPRELLGTDTAAPWEGWTHRRGAGELGSTGPIGDEPATLATVERAASLLAPPRPRYPDRLRAAGVTGRVLVRFVVDTAGRVEPASVIVRESSHDLFAQAVRAVLPLLRFRPAEVGGRRVRMLVDLPFDFRLSD